MCPLNNSIKGTGIFVNSGRSLRVESDAEVSQALGLSYPCHDNVTSTCYYGGKVWCEAAMKKGRVHNVIENKLLSWVYIYIPYDTINTIEYI